MCIRDRPSAPLPAPEHMFDSVVHPSDQTGTSHTKHAGLVPMTAPALGPASSLAKVARDNLARAGLAGMVEVRVEPRWETLPQLETESRAPSISSSSTPTGQPIRSTC